MSIEEEMAALSAALTPTDRIPREHVAICWDDHNGAAVDFCVMDFRAIENGMATKRIWAKADNTTGACMGSWMKGDPRATPEGVFSFLITEGEAPDGMQMAKILAEFAKIEGCDWAIAMLAAFVEQMDLEVWA